MNDSTIGCEPPTPCAVARTPDAVVEGDGVRLACYTEGKPGLATLVFVHGYPDIAGVWDRMVWHLAHRYRCVR